MAYISEPSTGRAWGNWRILEASCLAGPTKMVSSIQDLVSKYKEEGKGGKHPIPTSELHRCIGTHRHVCEYVCARINEHTHTHRKSTKRIESSVFIFPMERILKDKAIIRTMDLSQQGADSDPLRL